MMSGSGFPWLPKSPENEKKWLMILKKSQFLIGVVMKN